MEENKNKPKGRPPVTTDSLPENWRESIIALSKEGASFVELAVELGIARSTMYLLIDRDPEFSDTLKECKRHCEAWWKRVGRTNLENKEFSYTGWYMNMKNRFGWTDRVDNTTKGESINAPLTPEEIETAKENLEKDV